MVSMNRTDSSRSSARASSGVKLGRRIRSMKSLPDIKLIPLNFATKMVSGPRPSSISRNERSNPRTSDVIPTIAVIPITTPTIVNAERILFARSVSTAITPISLNSAARSFTLFLSERFNRAQPRRTYRWVQAKDQSYYSSHPNTKSNRPSLHGSWHRRGLFNGERHP